MKITPNRVAVILTVVAGVVGAVAPAVANMDWSSTAGVLGGLATIAVAVVAWLQGWQKHEADMRAQALMARSNAVATRSAAKQRVGEL